MNPIQFRRHLHMHPELSFREHDTAAFISARLSELGIEHRPIAGTGVLAKIEGRGKADPKRRAVVLRADIDALVTDLRRHNPGAELLLVTPAECYRRSTTRRGRGRRRRRVTTYAVNPNISRLRDVIADYARTHHIALYDWYEVAGGRGSGARWLADRNLGRDRIHLTADGYRLQGHLTADALLNALSTDPQ